MEKKLENRFKPGKVTRLTDEEVYETIIKPIQDEETQKIFDYLHKWRRESNRSDFIFDRYSIAV